MENTKTRPVAPHPPIVPPQQDPTDTARERAANNWLTAMERNVRDLLSDWQVQS